VTDDHTMHIGEVADKTSLSLRTLRHYDEIGLVNPSGRTEGGFRLYTAADVARLMLVRRMKPLGYSLEQMSGVLSAFDALAEDPGSGIHRAELDDIRGAALERKQKLLQQVQMADEFLTQLDELRDQAARGA
jgi:MerR family copper efflux transcriptional regulator